MERKEPIIGIYKLTSPNGKVYIGQSSNVEKRLLHYKRNNKKVNQHLQNALSKYSPKNFQYEIIEVLDSVDSLNEAEIRWISYYNSNNPDYGYNKTTGGTDRYAITEDTRKRMSKSHTGRKLPLEVRKKLTGKIPGKPPTEREIQGKKLMALKARGRKNKPHSPETRAKMSISAKNKPPVTQHTRDLMSLKRIGKKTNFSDEAGKSAIIARNKSRGKKVICNTTGIVYETTGDAERDLGILNVIKCCKGIIKSSKGYSFSFWEEETASVSVD